MSGHSHSKTIKHKKEITDQKRGKIFSKLLNAISIAAKTDPNPEFNPRLRQAVEKARESQVPQEHIERAIKRAKEIASLEELIIEAYGPAGCAILIEAISDNKNRTMAEIKRVLNENSSKLAAPGSVMWAFEKTPEGWQAKFKQSLEPTGLEKIKKLIEDLENQDEVQKVYINI